jgi:hypothetical protein
MNNEDLSIIAAEVAKNLFNTLYQGKDMDINEVDTKMAYCASVTDFVLKSFRDEMEKALNEQTQAE